MKEKIMFPYFPWRQPTQMKPLNAREAAKLEDLFYAEHGALTIAARVRKALELFAFKEKSNCKVKHPEVTAEASAHIFGSVGK
jgi:hypothetical protein